jgi:hypothetical protein
LLVHAVIRINSQGRIDRSQLGLLCGMHLDDCDRITSKEEDSSKVAWGREDREPNGYLIPLDTCIPPTSVYMPSNDVQLVAKLSCLLPRYCAVNIHCFFT